MVDDSNKRTKSFSNWYEENAYFFLSISHSLEDSEAYLSLVGIKKVKVNQVKDSGFYYTITYYSTIWI